LVLMIERALRRARAVLALCTRMLAARRPSASLAASPAAM